MKSLDHVQNGTDESNEATNLGRIRVIETQSGILIKHHITDCEQFVYEFSAFAVKTAQATLEMCRVVCNAKRALESHDFLNFCNDIGRNGEDATVRKYLKIGEKYDQFYQYAELLPNSWTSIYEITQLPSETFEALVKTDNSMANMTGAQIKALMGKGIGGKLQSTAAPTAAAPKAVQTASRASAAIGAASSATHATEADTASSNTTQTASIASVSKSNGVAADSPTGQPSSNSDREFAEQATKSMLERVAAAASTNSGLEAAEVCEPFEVTLRFKSKPTDAALETLVESVLSLKSKYRLEFEIKTQPDLVD
jgi:hypothetical protein